MRAFVFEQSGYAGNSLAYCLEVVYLWLGGPGFSETTLIFFEGGVLFGRVGKSPAGPLVSKFFFFIPKTCATCPNHVEMLAL